MILGNDLIHFKRKMKTEGDIYSQKDDIFDLIGNRQQSNDTGIRGKHSNIKPQDARNVTSSLCFPMSAFDCHAIK